MLRTEAVSSLTQAKWKKGLSFTGFLLMCPTTYSTEGTGTLWQGDKIRMRNLARGVFRVSSLQPWLVRMNFKEAVTGQYAASATLTWRECVGCGAWTRIGRIGRDCRVPKFPECHRFGQEQTTSFERMSWLSSLRLDESSDMMMEPRRRSTFRPARQAQWTPTLHVLSNVCLTMASPKRMRKRKKITSVKMQLHQTKKERRPMIKSFTLQRMEISRAACQRVSLVSRSTWWTQAC